MCMVTRSFLSIIEHVSDTNRRDFLVPLCFISYYRDFVSLGPLPFVRCYCSSFLF